jgi:hypothetical protein
LYTDIPRFRGVDINAVDQGSADNGYQSTDKLDRLEEAGLGNDYSTNYSPAGIESHKWEGVNATFDSGHTMDGLEIDGEIEQDLKVG